MTEAQLRTGIAAGVVATLDPEWELEEDGPKVIWAYSGTPRPSPPYVLMNIVSDIATGQVDRIVATGGDTTIREHREVTVDLQAISEDRRKTEPTGPRGWDILSHMRVKLCDDEIRTVFRTNNLAFRRRGNLQRIPQLLETSWEDQTSLEIVLGYKKDIETTPGEILSVVMTLTVEDPAGAELDEIEITADSED